MRYTVPTWMPESPDLQTLADRKSLESCIDPIKHLEILLGKFQESADRNSVEECWTITAAMAIHVGKLVDSLAPETTITPTSTSTSTSTNTNTKTPDQRRNESVWYFIRRYYNVNATELKKTNPTRYAELRTEALNLWDSGHLSPSGIRK